MILNDQWKNIDLKNDKNLSQDHSMIWKGKNFWVQKKIIRAFYDDHYERRVFFQSSSNDVNFEKIFELHKFLLQALVRNLIRTSSSF
jgi:hypothetical protein